MKKKTLLLLIIAGILIIIGKVGITDCNSRDFPIEGIGCWVQNNSNDNLLIYSDVFDWYIAHGNNLDNFINKKNKPLFMAFGGKDVDKLIATMKHYKSRIIGVVWDYEEKGTPKNVAEKNLRSAHAAAKQLGLLFGVVVKPDPGLSLKVNGISYADAASFSDFLMPMMYVQWYQMKKDKMEKLLEVQRSLTKLPIIAVIALETTMMKPPRKITPSEIVTIYKRLPVDAFCVWNVKNLSDEYIQALSNIKDPKLMHKYK